MNISYVFSVHVFNVHRGRIALEDHPKTGLCLSDFSQSKAHRRKSTLPIKRGAKISNKNMIILYLFYDYMILIPVNLFLLKLLCDNLIAPINLHRTIEKPSIIN